MSSVSVELEHVVKRFGRTRALDGVSLEAGAGITGLLGPNGAGKTTLLRIVATLLLPDGGHVRVLGRDPADGADRLEIRRRLGYLPQEPGLYRSFTAFEFVDYVAILKEQADRGRRHADVRRALELVDLGDVMHKPIRALSSGMRRRVALAQALLGDPLLLVLDEPTAGLDPEQRMRFRALVSQIARDRVVFLSTHQAEDVAALCARVVVLDRGEVRFDGAPARLAASARGRVWIADGDEPAEVSWRMADGRHRHVGTPPPGAGLAEPTLDDAYLMLMRDRAQQEAYVP